METMTYQEWSRKRQSRSASPRKRKRTTVVTLGVRERRRLLQLVVCVVLFLVVLVGKGVFPQRMAAVSQRILPLLHGDTDFAAVFSDLGASLEESGPVGESLVDACVSVFGAGGGQVVTVDRSGMLWARECGRSIAGIPAEGAAARILAGPEEEEEPFVNTFAAHTAGSTAETTPQAVVETEPEVVKVDYTGPALPANTSMDQYNLHLSQTVTPVLGWVSSPFGWREHPVDGEEKFHNGVDLAVNTGTHVQAFAAGTVDYIGDSPIYGLYLQLDHGGGVTTFYAHCDELLVQQGQSVTAGETVALSGATGNATGPHLHFELKKDGIRLNPIYYIETAEG